MNRLLGFLQVPGTYAVDWMARFGRSINYEFSRLTAFAGEVEWNPGSIASSGTSMASGTVTSVALAAPDIFTVSGSPVTTTGTLTFTATDPNADRIVFWDDSAGKWVYLTAGSGLSITDTTLTATGSGTVTSVALTMANDDTVSVTGSPVTTSGTLAAGAVDAGADKFIFWDDSAGKKVYGTLAGSLSFSGTELRDYQWLQFALGDQTTVITTGTKFTTRFPACTVLAVRISVNTVSSSGTPTVDIKDDGTTIFSTKPAIDVSEKTNVTGTAAVIDAPTIADDSEITFIVDTAGTGAKGLIATMQVRWT